MGNEVNEGKELWTVADVAAFLRTTPKAVRCMIGRGSLPGVVHVGRRVLVRANDVRASVGLTP